MIKIIARIEDLEESVVTLEEAITLKRCVGTEIQCEGRTVSVDDVDLTVINEDEIESLVFLVDFETSVFKRIIKESKEYKENHYSNSGVASFSTNWADEMDIEESVVIPENVSNTLIKWGILYDLMDCAETQEDIDNIQEKYGFNPYKEVSLCVGSNQDVMSGFLDLTYVPATQKELEVIERLKPCSNYKTSHIKNLIERLI